jgi:hypothetical protein
MESPQKKVTGWLTGYASGLRFPYLLALTAALFILNLIVIDPIPGVDEAVLLLITIMLSRLKKRKLEGGPQGERSEGTREAATGRDGRVG